MYIDKYPHLKHLPNWMTLARVAAAPVVVGLMMLLDAESPREPTGWNREISFLLGLIFSIAAVTDVIDGYLARKWEVESTMGAFLDPLADKLMILATMIMLVDLERAPAWVVIAILSREIAVTGLRTLAADKGIVISASGLGKYKTIFQVIAILGLLVWYQYDYTTAYEHLKVSYGKVGTVFLYVALVFTLWSGWEYFADFWTAASAQDKAEDVDGSAPPPGTNTV